MKNIEATINYFNELFPSPQCALEYKTPYELLVAVILSAQCTDKRVNIVTRKLFNVANTPQQMLDLGVDKLKDYIHSCGFYNNKAKSILSMSKDLLENHAGQVPKDLETLTKLSGVGRKTANVVIGTAFGGQTIAVDTHVHRISQRLGFCKQGCTAYECEKSLMKIVPKDSWTKFHHQTIWFGREKCKAIKPLCSECKLNKLCPHFKKQSKEK